MLKQLCNSKFEMPPTYFFFKYVEMDWYVGIQHVEFLPAHMMVSIYLPLNAVRNSIFRAKNPKLKGMCGIFEV